MVKHHGELSKIGQAGPLPQAATGRLQVQTRSRGGTIWSANEEKKPQGEAYNGNASIDIDGIMAVGVIWMPFSCSFLQSWAVDPRSSSGKTFSIMVRSSVKSWK
ncbi:hypothetical protein BHM03_00037909 [Ensete ventricosum]|nr:hypothetical protein BHM03_00037909 [Ensete ventricosum]